MGAKYIIFLVILFLIVGCTSVQDSSTGNIDSQQDIIEPEQKEVEVAETEEILVSCEGISGEQLDLCYIRKAVKENDDSECLKINNEFAQDVCYMQLAAWYNLPEYCDNVVIPKEKDLCNFGMAIQTSDLSLCDKIRLDTEIQTDQEICKKAAAEKNTKENIREEDLLDDDQILDIVYTTSDNVDKALIEAMNDKTQAPKIEVEIPSKIDSVDDANQWLTYYYLKPNPDLTTNAIKEIIQSEYYDPTKISGAFVGGFGEIFKQNKDKLKTWMSELEGLSEEERVLVWQALWFSDTSETKSILEDEKDGASIIFEDYLHTLLQEEPPNMLEDEIVSGDQLDMLWGMFFVTGKEEPINRIISTLPWSEEYKDEYDKRVADYESGKAKELTEEETLILVKYSVGAAAKWALTSNSVQHDKVFEICTKGIVEQRGLTKDILKEIVDEANTERLRNN